MAKLCSIIVMALLVAASQANEITLNHGWMVASLGESCNDVCSEGNGNEPCNEDSMKALKTAGDFEFVNIALGSPFTCSNASPKRYLYAPSFDESTNTCFFEGSASSCAQRDCAPTNTRRLCCCSNVGCPGPVETFSENGPLTDIQFLIGGTTPVSTSYVSSVGYSNAWAGQYGVTGWYLDLYAATDNVVVKFPENLNIVAFSFTSGAKNGDLQAVVTYKDQTTEELLVADNQCPDVCFGAVNFSGNGKLIESFTLPADYDWWFVDNVRMTAQAAN